MWHCCNTWPVPVCNALGVQINQAVEQRLNDHLHCRLLCQPAACLMQRAQQVASFCIFLCQHHTVVLLQEQCMTAGLIIWLMIESGTLRASDAIILWHNCYMCPINYFASHLLQDKSACKQLLVG
jgi:hypothetical protein